MKIFAISGSRKAAGKAATMTRTLRNSAAASGPAHEIVFLLELKSERRRQCAFQGVPIAGDG